MSEQEKQPTKEQLENLLRMMTPEGSKREAVKLGEDENGQPFGFIVWRKL